VADQKLGEPLNRLRANRGENTVTRTNRLLGAALASVVALGAQASAAAAQSTVDKIKQHGFMVWGASQGVPGMSLPDEKGVWSGYDVDICRAIAVAILGDREKARFVPLNTVQRLPAIQTGEIDVLSRTTTITYSHDAAVRFAARSQYDNDGLLIRKSLGVKQKKATALAGVELSPVSITTRRHAALSAAIAARLEALIGSATPITPANVPSIAT
jgi:ABC-type amino acid transport substrate-binding protein